MPSPRRRTMEILVCLASVGLVILASCGPGPDPGRKPQTKGGPGGQTAAAGAATADGAALYSSHCAVCHGTKGRGDGPAAYLLWPRPRDFSRGKFKLRSTPGLPTDADLMAVLTQGMPGSSMPAWSHLPEADRLALVAQVKRLSEFTDEETGQPFNHFVEKAGDAAVVVPAEPAATAESVALGKDVYARVGCNKCHGESGRADGPSAADLRDDWDQPIRPNDFTQGIFKGGSANRDIYLRFATGMNGTPMPAYGPDLMTDAERWALVHYVKSLSKGAPERLAATVKPGEAIVAARVEKVPTDPFDPTWDKIPPSEVALQLLFQRANAPRTLLVRAAHDGSKIALRLEWEDAAADEAALRPEDFRDGLAIQFALGGMDTPLLMGAKGKQVNIWHWKADWQADIAAYQDVEKAHPGMVVEMYPFQKGDPTNNKGSNPAAAPEHDPQFLSGTAAGNPMSATKRTQPCEELAAEGFGTLTSLPLEAQTISGKGLWKAGRWAVVTGRTLQPPDSCCVQFKPGAEVPVSFAVWDGGAGDRNGQKSVSMWYRLRLKE